VNNVANDGGGLGTGRPTTVSSCILWDNAPSEIAGTPHVTYSDIKGGFAGEGNIDSDPLFVDFAVTGQVKTGH
jgi:hypothetical protein